VSWSGHYVRDPFITKQRQTELLLRRRSHPLARIWRNLNQPLSLLLFTALGSAVCIGFASFLLPDVPKPVINQQHPTHKDIQSP